MTSPSKAFDSAISGVHDFMTKKITYNSGRPPSKPVTLTAPKPAKYSVNAQDTSTLPKGTMLGAYPTSQSKALQAKK